MPFKTFIASRRGIPDLFLALPCLLAILLATQTERSEYLHAKALLMRQAKSSARTEAQLVSLRLMQQFDALSFVAKGLIGPGNPGAMSPRTQRRLRGFAAQNRELFALNVLAPDGDRIVWSTRMQTSRPITLGAFFTPVQGHPDFLLGQDKEAARARAHVITMRYRMTDSSGRTLYFTGSPYRLNLLLANSGPSPFPLVVRDLREDSILGILRARTVAYSFRAQPGPEVRVPVALVPLAVEAYVPQSLIWHAYRIGLPWRLLTEALVIALFGAGGVGLSLLLRKQQQARQIARLSAFNTLLGQVNQTIAQAADQEGMLQALCELPVRHADMALAWIGRPDADGRLAILASAGRAMGFLDALEILLDAEGPQERGGIGSVWQSGEAHFQTFPAEGDALPSPLARARHYGLRACAGLPIHRGGSLWGVIALYSDQESLFDEAAQAVLSEVAADISYGLDALDRRTHIQTLVAALDAMLDGAVITDASQRIIYANPAFTRITGYSLAEVKEHHAGFLQGEGTDKATTLRVQRALTREEPASVEILNYRKDGTPFWNALSIVPIRDHAGKVTHFVGTQQDISDRRMQAAQIAALQRLYDALLSAGDILLQARDEPALLEDICERLVDKTMFHAVWIARPDADGWIRALAQAGDPSGMLNDLTLNIRDQTGDLPIIRAWNAGKIAFSNSHDAAAATPGSRDLPLSHPAHAALAAPIRRAGAVWGLLVFACAVPGSLSETIVPLCNRIAEMLGHALEELDLRNRLSELQAEEAHLARHDILTGLPNRLALEQHLAHAIARTSRRGAVLAIGMLDLDDFKPVNDRFGHETGDELLRQLSRRLQNLLRTADFIARLGGDEFVLVIEDLDDLQAIQQLRNALSRLHQAVEKPFDLGDGRQAVVGMSMGVALYPIHAGSQDALLRQADAAMYQAKVHKADRVHWWRLAGAQTEMPGREAPFDPFGSEAQDLLRILEPPLGNIIDDFMAGFSGELTQHAPVSAILRCLSAAELSTLGESLTEHLRFLLQPETGPDAVRGTARGLGTILALTGVSGAWMTQAANLFHEVLRSHLEAIPSATRTRYRTLRAAEARLQLSLQTELDTMQEVVDTYDAHLARPVPSSRNAWASLAQAELDALGELPGLKACLLLRPDIDGTFVIEFAAGAAQDAMRRIAHTQGMAPHVDSRNAAGHGLIAQAWRTKMIQHTDAYGLDERTQVWHGELAALEVRSLTAIPVIEGQAVEFVLTLLGAYPHQFSTNWVRTFTASLQNRWNQVVRLAQKTYSPPIMLEHAARYRGLLYSDRLRMYMQPVVDLRTGKTVRVETLARLLADDGQVIAPAQFLPALGDNDLDTLFRLGINQAMAQAREWRAQGADIGLSINLSPSTLLHPDCALWVEDALRRHDIAPRALTIELMETQELEDIGRDEALDTLLRSGIQLAIDDLGSGYSSLKRLARLPVHIVKIDQAIVSELGANPVKTLSLIRTIIQMGADFDYEVVVEGVEDASVIEAVAILGARFGQGYGLAPPMPAEELLPWLRKRTDSPMDGQSIHTDLGALAYHWSFMHKGQPHMPADPSHCPITTFLIEQGLEGSEAARWHERLHRTREGAEAAETSAQFTRWLVSRIQQRYRRPSRTRGETSLLVGV